MEWLKIEPGQTVRLVATGSFTTVDYYAFNQPGYVRTLILCGENCPICTLVQPEETG